MRFPLRALSLPPARTPVPAPCFGGVLPTACYCHFSTSFGGIVPHVCSVLCLRTGIVVAALSSWGSSRSLALRSLTTEYINLAHTLNMWFYPARFARSCLMMAHGRFAPSVCCCVYSYAHFVRSASVASLPHIWKCASLRSLLPDDGARSLRSLGSWFYPARFARSCLMMAHGRFAPSVWQS